MEIKNAGFDVSLNGDSFRITPASFFSTRQREFLKLHKAEIINELQSERIAIQTESENFVSCGKCLGFKFHNLHGQGAGYCLVGGDYGLWSKTQHQCEKYNSKIKALTVTCYTPNGESIQIEAKDEAHAVWLKK
jgi:hypothetical protein